jgi:ribonucleoside-diphosphate reductase alpha chain
VTERKRLPNRRGSESFEIEHAGLRYSVSFSRFEDGTPAEVFINNHKRGNASDVAARDAGILLSFCLQYGVPAEVIARALSRNSDGSASGAVAAALDQILGENP